MLKQCPYANQASSQQMSSAIANDSRRISTINA